MTPRGARGAGLDLLRGIAVGLVILRHALPTWFPGAGVVGVVMFFAISGYLITGVLLDEHARTGRVHLRGFYVRRARRLVPALLVLVLVYVVVTAVLDPLDDRGDLVHDTAVALTWTGNLPGLTPAGATYHLWTLATEEQFYLLWPALLLTFAARGRAVGALWVAGPLALLAGTATVAWLTEAPDLAYALPTSWAGCFVIGAAARLLRDRIGTAGLARWRVALALAGLATLSLTDVRGHPWTYLVVGPLVATLSAVLLLAWREWTVVTGPLQALVALGVVSYGAYLWNYPLTLWLRPAGPVTAALLGTALTLLAAWASHRWVERPFLARRTSDCTPSIGPARDRIPS